MKALLMALAASPLITGPGTAYFSGMPPERYQSLAVVKMVVVRESELHRACNSEPVEGLKLLGCARADWFGRPYIVIPDTCPRGEVDQTARIICHELAHAVGGWPADHPE